MTDFMMVECPNRQKFEQIINDLLSAEWEPLGPPTVVKANDYGTVVIFYQAMIREEDHETI